MKRLAAVTVAVLALAMTARTFGAGGIEGSPHDMSNKTTYPWNTRNGVCSPCHAAHHTDPSQLIPLWTHSTTPTVFTPYSSPTLNAVVGAPKGVSLACLSCHDGTVALNSFYTAGTNSITGGAAMFIPAGDIIPDGAGNDMHAAHPISFTYDAALAAADGQLENPATYHIGDVKSIITSNVPPVPTSWSGTSLTGKLIKDAMLFGAGKDQMECASCHDPHKLAGSAPTSGIMTRISGTDAAGMGSTLCRTCHIK
jgi:hypothetical protein